MRALNYSILAIVFLLLGYTTSAKDKYDKKFHESYDVNKETLFDISNKYGDIIIENTQDNLITIDAEIIVEANSEEQANKVFEKISIQISKSANTVKAVTEIDDLKLNNVDLEINYTVKMPAFMAIKLLNKYGHVTINELHGKSNIAVKYGSLNVNKITDGNTKPLSSVQLGYCERSQINEFNWGTLVVKYSKVEVNSGKALVVSSKYSKVSIGNFSSVVAEAGYDDYKVGNVMNFILESKYSDINVQSIQKKFILDNKYGNVTVYKIPDGFAEISVISKYAGVDLGIETGASYLLDASARYADIHYNDLKVKERIKESNSITIKGKAGEKETESKVKIQSEYGNVDLRQK